MCGGGAGKLIKGGLDLLGASTGAVIAGPLGAVAGYGLGNLAGSLLSGPEMPDMPEPARPGPDQTTAAADAAAAQAAAQARERRRAAARFGRASTIGAGRIGAPAMGGKMAVGS